MSVSDELSSDVAVALLEMKGALNTRDVNELLVMFRTTLLGLSTEERKRRRAKFLSAPPPDSATSASPTTN